mmetsp:Transcript_6015/g.12248  ORF Transcript_6015/g.12248 Transcript_6015/m.12248 type:complete len:231 (+) Transcript_6015:108-800(+)
MSAWQMTSSAAVISAALGCVYTWCRFSVQLPFLYTTFFGAYLSPCITCVSLLMGCARQSSLTLLAVRQAVSVVSTARRFSASLLMVLVMRSVKKYSAAAGNAFFECFVSGSKLLVRIASTSLNSVNRRWALLTFSSLAVIFEISSPATAAPFLSVPWMASSWNRSSESLEMDSSLRMKDSTNGLFGGFSRGSLDSVELRICSWDLVALLTAALVSEGSPILETLLDAAVD